MLLSGSNCLRDPGVLRRFFKRAGKRLLLGGIRDGNNPVGAFGEGRRGFLFAAADVRCKKRTGQRHARGEKSAQGKRCLKYRLTGVPGEGGGCAAVSRADAVHQDFKQCLLKGRRLKEHQDFADGFSRCGRFVCSLREFAEKRRLLGQKPGGVFAAGFAGHGGKPQCGQNGTQVKQAVFSCPCGRTDGGFYRRHGLRKEVVHVNADRILRGTVNPGQVLDAAADFSLCGMGLPGRGKRKDPLPDFPHVQALDGAVGLFFIKKDVQHIRVRCGLTVRALRNLGKSGEIDLHETKTLSLEKPAGALSRAAGFGACLLRF